MSNTCSECKHSKQIVDNDEGLHCHRFPPSGTAANPIHAVFPIVGYTEYCSEFSPMNGTTTPPTEIPKMGVTDGSEAAAGEVGEYLVIANTSGITLPSNSPLAICQISLSAGDWEIWGTVDFQPAAGVSPNGIAAAVSLYPNSLPTETDLMTGVGVLNMFTTSSLTSGQRQVLMTGTCRSNSAEPMVLFLVGQTTLGGSGILTAKGYICARRMR